MVYLSLAPPEFASTKRNELLDKTHPRKRRMATVFAIVLGVIGIVIGSLFIVAGAGMYGSPFQGGAYFNRTLMLVLVFGPFAILPCAVFDIWKPGWGGLLLCACSTVDVAMIILNNWSEYGFSVYNSASASTFVALPLFMMGSSLYFTGRSTATRGIWIWRMLLALLTGVFLFFAFKLGPDHWFFIEQLFHHNNNPPELPN